MLILSNRSKFLGLLLVALGIVSVGRADSGAVAALVGAENNFAKAAPDHGIRRSFIDNFAPEGVAFRPAPTNTKASCEKQEEKGGLLIWRPIFAAVAATGELGFTTGPYEFKESASAQKPVAYGQFLSVWRKQSDNSWKVMVDAGIDHPQPAAPAGNLQILLPNEKLRTVDTTARKEALENAEQVFTMGSRPMLEWLCCRVELKDYAFFATGHFP